MKIVAGLAVIALVIVAFAQGYKAVSEDGRLLTARNTKVVASDTARTPSGVIDWQVSLAEVPDDAIATTPDPDGIGNIADNVAGALVGSYATLAENGEYTEAEGERVAEEIAASLKASVSYPIYSAADLKTDTDTSYERMLAYRNDLRVALEPLLKNPGYELGLFANYVESREANYLDSLYATAVHYRLAVENAANVVVPSDAVREHAEILNALSEFGAVIERLARHADDAFASAALLRTYQSSEANMVTSFNKLAEYYRAKKS